MKEFWKAFLEQVHEASAHDRKNFRDRYNNHAAKSSRNRTTRTELLLGNGSNRNEGLILKAVNKVFSPRQAGWHDPSFDRFNDLVFWSGDFIKGDRIAEFTCEVDMGPDLRATLSLLFAVQSRRKLAVHFFGETTKDAEIGNALVQVQEQFWAKGLREAEGTDYLILIGSPSIESKEDATQGWRALHYVTPYPPAPQQTPQLSWLERIIPF